MQKKEIYEIFRRGPFIKINLLHDILILLTHIFSSCTALRFLFPLTDLLNPVKDFGLHFVKCLLRFLWPLWDL